MNQDHRPAIVGSVGALLVLVAGGFWVISQMSMKDVKRDNLVVANTPSTQSNKTVVSGDTLHEADANGLVNAQMLECVPRGHDNYRTNSTLAVDPKDDKNVYVGVEYKGFFKSTDGGATWQQSDKGVRGYAMEGDPTKKCIQELGRTAIDPSDNQHILLSRVESPGTLQTQFSENAGVYESKDGGMTWSQMVKPGMNASGSQAIAFDPKNSQTIYYGVNNMTPSFGLPNGQKQTEYFNKTGILCQTTNSGQTWTELPTGADHGFRAMNVAVDPADSNHIWLFTFNQGEDGGIGSPDKQKGAIVTTDGGKTWKSVTDNFPNDYRALSGGWVAPTNGNNALVTTQTQMVGPKSYATTDGGKTWKETSVFVLAANYDQNDASGKHLLGYAPYASAPGIYESTDAGVNWKLVSKLPAEVTDNIRISNFVWSNDKDVVYMSGSGALVWKSTDDGKTWKNVMNLETVGGPNKNKDGQTYSNEPDH